MYEAVECHEYLELPALTIGVDGDGAGRTVILELEEMGPRGAPSTGGSLP